MVKKSKIPKRKKDNGENNKKLRVVLIVVGVVLIMAVTSFTAAKIYVKGKLNKVDHVEIPKDNDSLGIDSNTYKDTFSKADDSITNILLLGTDSRDPKSDPGNSDSMMVLTVDKKTNKLKITSIMRDSIVDVEGHGQRKLTESHNIGGALLTLKTINQNYSLNIKDYVQVNFFGLEKIIDYIGGVPVNVTAAEIQVANQYIDEAAGIEHVAPKHLTNAGLQTLNGIQAVGYCRIRYVGNNDFQRTERQRTVLSEVFKKLATTNVADIGRAIDTIAPYVETSIKSDDIMSEATYILTHKMTSLEQNRVPYEGLYQDQKVNGEAGLAWDKQATIDKLHGFIFGENSN